MIPCQRPENLGPDKTIVGKQVKISAETQRHVSEAVDQHDHAADCSGQDDDDHHQQQSRSVPRISWGRGRSALNRTDNRSHPAGSSSDITAEHHLSHHDNQPRTQSVLRPRRSNLPSTKIACRKTSPDSGTGPVSIRWEQQQLTSAPRSTGLARPTSPRADRRRHEQSLSPRATAAA